MLVFLYSFSHHFNLLCFAVSKPQVPLLCDLDPDGDVCFAPLFQDSNLMPVGYSLKHQQHYDQGDNPKPALYHVSPEQPSLLDSD